MSNFAAVAIQTIIFDLGGVIIDVEEQRSLDAFRQLGFQNIEEVYSELLNDGTLDSVDTGDMQPDELFDRLNTYCIEPADPQDLALAWNAMLGEIPEERIKLLRTLSSEYRLLLLSNTNSIHLQHIESMVSETYGIVLNDLFTSAYYSFLVGLRKPDPEVFRHVLQAEQLVADETLLLDDQLENVESARKLGLQTEWISESNPLLSLFSD